MGLKAFVPLLPYCFDSTVKMTKKETITALSFNNYVFLFIVSSLLGFAVETLWCLIKHGHIESRKSLVLGHMSIAYGMGAVLLTLILIRFQNASWPKIFLISFITGTVTEYICSLGQEIIFGSVAWDYSHLPLNINGRVCLIYSLFWGVLGVAWTKLIIPLMGSVFTKVHIPYENIFVGIFLVYFVFNCTLSAGAALRMNARDAGKAPSNSVEEFFDTHYPDEKMHKIYANSRNIEDIDARNPGKQQNKSH